MLTRVELKITPTYSTYTFLLLSIHFGKWPRQFRAEEFSNTMQVQCWRLLTIASVFISTGCTVIPGQSGQRSVMDPIVFPVTAARQKWPQSQLFKSQVSKHDEGQQYHLETPPPTHHSKDVVSLTSGRCLNCLVLTPGGLSYQTLHSVGSLKNTLFKMCPISPSLEHKVFIMLQLAISI